MRAADTSDSQSLGACPTTSTRLWQRYGYERVLRGTDETFAVAKYILENPVRAGIVRAPRDYPYLGMPDLVDRRRAGRGSVEAGAWSG